jgi:transposase
MHLVGSDSIIIGVDVHKYSHQAVALSCFGQELSKLSFTNDEIQKCIEWLDSLGSKKNIIIGLEDVNGLGIHLTKKLQSVGFHIRYVPAVYTERARKHSSSKDKNDYLDAKRVGKVILNNSEETLPASIIVPQEIIRTLDLLVQEREEIVKQQTALKNQLHTLLHQYYGNSYKQTFSDIFSDEAREWYSKDINEKLNTSDRQYIAGGIIRRYQRLSIILHQADETSKLIEETGKTLQPVKALKRSLKGCGALTACKILVEVGAIQRFATEAKLAKYAGIAPMQSQSGNNNRHYTNPYGNRKLNRAVNTIVLTQIHGKETDPGRIYYEKKLKEGKSKLWAMRCLKRFVIRKIFALLASPDKNIQTNLSY